MATKTKDQLEAELAEAHDQLAKAETVRAPAEKPTVFEAWNEVMNGVQAIRKGERSGSGQGGPSYNFRGVDTVTNAVGPLLRRHGVTVVPEHVAGEHRDFLDKKDKTVHESILTVTYRVYGPRGDSFTMETIGGSSDYSDKAPTQAMSVAYRIALLQGLCVPTDDPEPDAVHVERGEADLKAQAAGWETQAERMTMWNHLVAHPQMADPDVVAWGQAEGLDPATFTKAQGEEWTRRLIEAANPGAYADTSGPTPTPEIPTGEVTNQPAAHGGFPTEDERALFWANMTDRMAELPEDQRQDVIDWGAKVGISPETLTRAQGEEWMTQIITAETGATLEASGDEPF
jgi:hypothetical protein